MLNRAAIYPFVQGFFDSPPDCRRSAVASDAGARCVHLTRRWPAGERGVCIAQRCAVALVISHLTAGAAGFASATGATLV
jgi:hypothetical protein